MALGLDDRRDIADGLQVGLIEFLWGGLHPGQGKKQLAHSLREEVHQAAGVSDIRFLRSGAADFLIEKLANQLNGRVNPLREAG